MLDVVHIHLSMSFYSSLPVVPYSNPLEMLLCMETSRTVAQLDVSRVVEGVGSSGREYHLHDSKMEMRRVERSIFGT